MADYEFLTVDTVADYLRERPKLAEIVDPANLVNVAEVGDGNLNLVFLAHDANGNGICLKQSLPYVRMTGEGWPMTPDRAIREANALAKHYALSPELVPEVYDFNPERYVIAMEDLSDHRVWRGALNEGAQHEGVATAMGQYIAAVAFGTSAMALEREPLSEAIAQTQNPQLCEITEDLVFTEPAHDIGRNSVLPANQPDADRFATNPQVVAGLGEAKWLFMTRAEALIHGDLHTGSVMVRADESGRTTSIKAFDSEFAFYGPVAFDLGAVWANYVLAAARAYALQEDDRAQWCLAMIEQTWQAFEKSYRELWPTRRDPRVWDDAFLERRLEQWRGEAWLFAGSKMSRRIVGAAKVTDVQTLPEELREGAARGVLDVATQLFTTRMTDPSASTATSEIVALATKALLAARTV